MALIPGIIPDPENAYPATPQELLVLLSGFLTAPETKKNRPLVSVYALGTGATINASANGLDETVVINNTSTYATQTFFLPSPSNSVAGQTVRLFARDVVTAITVNTNGNDVRGAALPAGMTAGQSFAWQKIDGATWVRLQ
jgi:hypothetical protein